MSAQQWDRQFRSHVDFYREVYGQHVRSIRTVGNRGASLFEAEQSAGDWSDAPTPDLTIAWAPAGEAEFTIDLGAGRFREPRGRRDAILIAPGAGAAIQAEGAHSCLGVTIPYSKLLDLAGHEEAGLPADGDFGRLHTTWLSDRALAAVLDRLWRETAAPSAPTNLLADALVLELVSILLRIRNGRVGQGIAAGGLSPRQLKRVLDVVEAMLSDDLSMVELADEAGLSASHFRAAFKVSTGVSPTTYVTRRRIDRAKDLLARVDLPLSAVALACGYCDQQHFSRRFREATGLSPKGYRDALT